MVRKSEVFVEYEPANELPLSWARRLAADLRGSGLYRAVKVSKSRAREGAAATGRVWVDQRSSRFSGSDAETDGGSAQPVAGDLDLCTDSDKEGVA